MKDVFEVEKSVRLLVVDDDEAIQILMKAVFYRCGIDVDLAADGEAALAKMRRVKYDAIVLDLMLPVTNGFEVIRALKATAPDILDRTIVLTAAADRTLQHFSDAKAVRRVMRKPFDLDDFVDEVLSCFSPSSDAAHRSQKFVH
jgi:CheY-like chemotaxis protein